MANVWLATAFLCLCFSAPGFAWGERGHRLVNAAAVENLPEPLRSYFRAGKAFLVEHAVDPDLVAREDPAEHSHHYTEVEAYDPYPFLRFRKLFVDEGQSPTSHELAYGDSVWQIDRYARRLEKALRLGRWDEAEHAAIFAAHYACDLTQPLHTVLNYDGQLTHQSGIHARFETELVNLLSDRWVLRPRPAAQEINLRARIFREMLESYHDRILVFAADREARAGRSYEAAQFFPAFAEMAGPLARRRLEAAISFVSSLWYTAWVRAGKPVLRSADDGERVGVSLRAGCGRNSSRRPGAWRACFGAETNPLDGDDARRREPECVCGLSAGAARAGKRLELGCERKERLRGLS